MISNLFENMNCETPWARLFCIVLLSTDHVVSSLLTAAAKQFSRVHRDGGQIYSAQRLSRHSHKESEYSAHLASRRDASDHVRFCAPTTGCWLVDLALERHVFARPASAEHRRTAPQAWKSRIVADLIVGSWWRRRRALV